MTLKLAKTIKNLSIPRSITNFCLIKLNPPCIFFVARKVGNNFQVTAHMQILEILKKSLISIERKWMDVMCCIVIHYIESIRVAIKFNDPNIYNSTPP